jgi:hypothetical protein
MGGRINNLSLKHLKVLTQSEVKTKIVYILNFHLISKINLSN